MAIIRREITSKINWMIENLLPPAVRDCRPIMKFIIRFVYGDCTDLLLEFKERYPLLSDEEIGEYYSKIQYVPINVKRQT